MLIQAYILDVICDVNIQAAASGNTMGTSIGIKNSSWQRSLYDRWIKRVSNKFAMKNIECEKATTGLLIFSFPRIFWRSLPPTFNVIVQLADQEEKKSNTTK